MTTPSERLAAAIRSYTAGHSLNDCDDDNCLLCAAAAALWMCEACTPSLGEPEPSLPGLGRPRITYTDVNGRRGCSVCFRTLPLSEFERCSKRGNYRAQCRRCRKEQRKVSRPVADFRQIG